MNRDDVIRMAREAEFCDAKQMELNIEWTCVLPELQHFANLVEAAEREACAKVAENSRFLHDDSPEAKFGKACAAAIRARRQD